MKRLKWILAAIAGLALLAVAGIVLFIATFDPNKYKPDLVRMAAERYGRTLAIEGDIGLAVFPRLGVTLGRTRLSEADGKAPFAEITGARVSLALLPLLSRRVVVDRVVLDGLRLTLVRHRDGTTNTDDLLARKPAAPASPGSAERGASMAIDIAGVELHDAAVTWRDEAARREVQFTGLALTTGRIANDAPGKLELSARVASSAPKLAGTVALASNYRLNLATSVYEIAEARLSANTTDGMQLKAAIPSARLAPDARLIEIPSVAVEFNTNQAGGKATTPIRWERDAERVRLTKIEAQASLKSPALAVSAAGTGEFDMAKSIAHADLVFRFDDTNAQLKATLGASPAIRFALAVDRLNLDRFRASTPAAAPAGGASHSSPASPVADTPIDLSALQGVNAAGTLEIGTLVASNLKLEQVRMHAQAAGGKLELNPIQARLYQGTLSGAATIDANTHRFAIRDRLENVAVGTLLHDLAAKDVLDGRGTIVLDLATGGKTMSALKRGLAGSASFDLRDAAIRGINLAEVFRRAQAVAAGRGLQDIQSVKTEKTGFSELTASFSVRNGVAHSDDLNGKSPFLRLSGAGDVDIAAGAVDYRLKVQTTGSATGQGGREQDARRGVTLPVQVSGPFDALRYQVDVQGMAVEAVKDEAKKRLEEAIGKRLGDEPAGRAARDLLKGLLGR